LSARDPAQVRLCPPCCATASAKFYNAQTIKLTPLGRKLVAPEEENEELLARREAILQPRISREFFEKYNNAKFPNDTICGNVLNSLGIPRDRVQHALEIIKENGLYAGVIRETNAGLYVNIDSPAVPSPRATLFVDQPNDDVPAASPTALDTSAITTVSQTPSEANRPQPPATNFDTKVNRVFITHGKQKALVAQIKELLVFGHFEPIVSVERETTAIPVPEKVFEDMRSCGAGVIHVGAEGKYLDKDGDEHFKLNDNVLIEIGAAMALYGKKVILLVERGVPLPSNLQGLYRCEYDGDKLDYEATMKLLKTFSQFR
jgi:predicted nucleotide-binding protein